MTPSGSLRRKESKGDLLAAEEKLRHAIESGGVMWVREIGHTQKRGETGKLARGGAETTKMEILTKSCCVVCGVWCVVWYHFSLPSHGTAYRINTTC